MKKAEFSTQQRLRPVLLEQYFMTCARNSGCIHWFQNICETGGSVLMRAQKAYFANHSQRVTNLEDGYAGEREDYHGMWPYQKKIWEWGAEMTVAAIKEVKEKGENEPTREYQLTRTYHLLANQLSPGFDIRYCFRRDNKGGNLVIRYLLASFVLGILVDRLFNSLRERG